jgi:hypothetical protein
LLRVEGCSNRIVTAKILNRPEVDIVDWDERRERRPHELAARVRAARRQGLHPWP